MRPSQRIRRALLRRLLPIPLHARHAEYSVIASADDEPSRPSTRLLSSALEAIRNAQTIRLDAISARTHSPIDFLNTWPGEQYRLLSGLVMAVTPRLIVEIGTGSGGSALAMQQAMPPDSKLVTFDLVGWRSAPEGILREDDFRDGRLAQYTDDVSQPEGFAKHRTLLEDADLIFIDAAKDGVMEPRLLAAFRTLTFPRRPLLVFDDIRVWNMLAVWRRIPWPKLDLTSFGHWTGTGLVDVTEAAVAGNQRAG